MTDTQKNIIVFTDGSSRGNPGPGGWGAIVLDTEGKVIELGGREEHTTNNRMELSAVKESLACIESRKLSGDIDLYVDSSYVLNGVTGWMYGWENNGWKTKTGDPVLNQDLWKEIGALVFRLKQGRTLNWNKIKGHAGHLGNERADEIATAAADGEQQILFTGKATDYKKIIGGDVFDIVAPTTAGKSKKSGPGFSYISMIGGLIEVHKTWAECEARVKGRSGARFKKASSQEEENSIVTEWTNTMLGKNM